MAKLTEKEQRSRVRFDFISCMEMARRCDLLQLEAYGSVSDLRARTRQITDATHGHGATHYLAIYDPLKTLCGPGEFVDEVRIHVDVHANGNYPFSPPASWVISNPMPWSPHFKQGAVICIGDLWDPNGETLLGHLIRHLARLLNWDEQARGGGYVGWNGQAIAWHRKHYGNMPLTQGLAYPELPSDVVYGVKAEPEFSAKGRRSRPDVSQPGGARLFKINGAKQ
jgi:hypothetical protein